MGWFVVACSLVILAMSGYSMNYLSGLEDDFREDWVDVLNGEQDRLILFCGVLIVVGVVLLVVSSLELCYRRDVPAVTFIIGEISSIALVFCSLLSVMVGERASAIYNSVGEPYRNNKGVIMRRWAEGVQFPEFPENLYSTGGVILGVLGGVLAVVFLLKFVAGRSENKYKDLNAVVCISCGKPLVDGATFCTRCGTSQVPAEKVCINCGKSLEEDALFCSACGTEQYAVDTEDDDIFYDEDGGEYAICSNCGAIISANVSFCGKCGTKQ